jgi:6-phosphogluconolactonase/glucosamine-6-phosphate isomerase/deaminase
LVTGESKAEAVRHVLMDKPPVEETPSAGVQPLDGKLLWLLDSGASSLLPDDYT